MVRLNRRSQPGLEAATVWLEGHRLEDGLGEERVTADQSDDPHDQDERAKAESDPAAVSRPPLVTTTLILLCDNLRSSRHEANFGFVSFSTFLTKLDIRHLVCSSYD